jgi:hypothetical protein
VERQIATDRRAVPITPAAFQAIASTCRSDRLPAVGGPPRLAAGLAHEVKRALAGRATAASAGRQRKRDVKRFRSCSGLKYRIVAKKPRTRDAVQARGPPASPRGIQLAGCGNVTSQGSAVNCRTMREALGAIGV